VSTGTLCESHDKAPCLGWCMPPPGPPRVDPAGVVPGRALPCPASSAAAVAAAYRPRQNSEHSCNRSSIQGLTEVSFQLNLTVCSQFTSVPVHSRCIDTRLYRQYDMISPAGT